MKESLFTSRLFLALSDTGNEFLLLRSLQADLVDDSINNNILKSRWEVQLGIVNKLMNTFTPKALRGRPKTTSPKWLSKALKCKRIAEMIVSGEASQNIACKNIGISNKDYRDFRKKMVTPYINNEVIAEIDPTKNKDEILLIYLKDLEEMEYSFQTYMGE